MVPSKCLNHLPCLCDRFLVPVLVPILVLFKFRFWSLFKFPFWFLFGCWFWFLFKFLFRFLFRHRCMGIQNSWKLTWFGTAKSNGVGWNSCASDAVAVVWEVVKHHLFLGSDTKQQQCMYLVFARMPGESCRRQLQFLLLCGDIFWVLINSLVCWFCRSTLGLALFQNW